jgi:hypothetical protein
MSINPLINVRSTEARRTLYSMAGSAFSFRVHLLERRFDLPARFLIRGDLLDLYNRSIGGHNGKQMIINNRRYRFTKVKHCNDIIASSVKRVSKKKTQSVKTFEGSEEGRTYTTRSTSRRVTSASKPKAKVNQKAIPAHPSPDTVVIIPHVSMKALDSVKEVIEGLFPSSQRLSLQKYIAKLGSLSKEEKASLVEYRKRANWLVIKGEARLVLKGRNDTKVIFKTEGGYELRTLYGGLKSYKEFLGTKKEVETRYAAASRF